MRREKGEEPQQWQEKDSLSNLLSDHFRVLFLQLAGKSYCMDFYAAR